MRYSNYLIVSHRSILSSYNKKKYLNSLKDIYKHNIILYINIKNLLVCI